MIYVSMIEIFFKARESLAGHLGEDVGYVITVLSFFGGILFIGLIDYLIPSGENPHEVKMVEEMEKGSLTRDPRLMKMGFFTALAIAIHNFPEGLATFTASLSDPALGVA